MNVKAGAWYGQADQFMISSNVLEEYHKDTGIHTVTAFITCRAFATEAFLKCLLSIHDLRVPREHDLRLLFRQLPKNDKDMLSLWWSTEQPLNSEGPTKGLPFEWNPPQTLNQALEESGKAFINWRYLPDSPTVWCINGFSALIRRRILQLRPTWLHSPPDAYGVNSQG